MGIAYFEAPHNNSALRNMLGKVPSDYYTKKNSAKGLYEGVVHFLLFEGLIATCFQDK